MQVSVITCSRKYDDNVGLIQSFDDRSIEAIEIVNATSMGAGFNEGMKKAKGDVLIFTHTDVRVWANHTCLVNLYELAMRESTGFVGVAGATTLPPNCVWWNAVTKLGSVAHIHGAKIINTLFGYYGRALVMDGVLLAIARHKCPKWIEDGWHFYDIDATLRVGLSGLKNYVVPFPMVHSSIGNMPPEWDDIRIRFYKSLDSPNGYSLPDNDTDEAVMKPWLQGL